MWNADEGEGGVKNLPNFADVICSWPLNREDTSRISCEKFKWVVQFISIEGSKRTNSSFGRHIFVYLYLNMGIGSIHFQLFVVPLYTCSILVSPSLARPCYSNLALFEGTTEISFIMRSRFGEVCSCCSEIVLPGPAWAVFSCALRRIKETSVYADTSWYAWEYLLLRRRPSPGKYV